MHKPEVQSSFAMLLLAVAMEAMGFEDRANLGFKMDRGLGGNLLGVGIRQERGCTSQQA
jgi:hypothetical protein